MKQYIIGGFIGALVLFVILKMIAKKPKQNKDSKTVSNLIEVAKTSEAKNLILSDEFTALRKTEQFKRFATDYGLEALTNFIQV